MKDKARTLIRLKHRLELALRTDLGDQTEYVDRALDQIRYALEELLEDEAEFQRGVDDE